jgi:hypothetical protein
VGDESGFRVTGIRTPSVVISRKVVLPVELESNNHSVFLMHYHLVLVVKYRRRVITDAVSDRAREIFERIAPTYGITLDFFSN